MPFIGRDFELGRAMEIIESKQRYTLLIDGSPGVGKTRFLEECISRWNGIALFGTCSREEETISFQPVVIALKSIVSGESWQQDYTMFKRDINFIWWRNLRWLIPEIAPFDTSQPTPPTSQLSLMDAIKRFILLLSRARPVLLVIDELHYAIEESIALLSHIINDPSQNNVTYLFSRTPARFNPYVAQMMQRLNYDGTLRQIKLNRLDSDCVSAFAKLISETDPRICRWLEEKTAGNAYILTAYVKYALNCLESSADRKSVLDSLIADKKVPTDINSYILLCLSGLSVPACRLPYVASVCGMDFNFETVAAAAELQINDALNALQEVMKNALIRLCPDGNYRFDHVAVREAIFAAMSPSFHNQIRKRLEETAARRTEQ